jgi:mono/diheme cytochrome c family protein
MQRIIKGVYRRALDAFFRPVLSILVLCLTATGAGADEDDVAPHAEAVSKLVMQRDIEITYDYVATLMRLPNAFGEGAACVICHGSNDPARSYRGLDLTTCRGIVRGATEPPARPIITPGKKREGALWRHLHHNRMPFGVAFDYPRDTANIKAVRKWIDDGAKNDNRFNRDVLPLFSQKEAFGLEESCVRCHMSNSKESVNELDLTSYKGVMLGANAVSRGREGLPPSKVVTPGSAADSPLYQRLVENRMPAGIDPGENKDHPNTLLLMRWVEQGAKCN